MQSALMLYLIHKFSKVADAVTKKIENFKQVKDKEKPKIVSTKTIIVIDEDKEKQSVKMCRYEDGLEKEKFIYERAASEREPLEFTLPPNPLKRYRSRLNSKTK